MQLKLRRSQRDGGVVSKTVIFCLDARAEFTPDELASIARHKLGRQVIYNSQAARRHLEAGEQAAADTAKGYLKQIGRVALAAMNFNISIDSLQRGQHIECKDLDELLAAEETLLTSCETLKRFLDVAATFDGREVVFDFSSQEPTIVSPVAPRSLTSPAPVGPGPETVAPSAPVAASSSEAFASGTPAYETSYATPPPGYASVASAPAGADWFDNFGRWWDGLSGGERIAVIGGALFTLFVLYHIF